MNSKKLAQNSIVNILADQYTAEKIILFGSRARGDAGKDSDFDLVVIKKTKEPFLRRMREVAKILSDARITQSADVLVYTPEEFAALSKRWNPFFHRILKEGKIVYGK
ncbi:MAG: nucleotidyltransferase domain-containing protein [bacterium]|nr:nucleotidyltransferase domain-containing protein [bacterium]